MNATQEQPGGARRTYMCDQCAIRHFAEAHPDSMRATFWRLHTRVCPMWTSYAEMTDTPSPALQPQDTRLVATVLTVVGGAVLTMLFRRR